VAACFGLYVKLLASAVALACALVLVIVAAPALSSARWRPAPVDFELGPEAGAAHARGGGGFVSRPLRAGKRFNLVGLRWRGRAEPAVAIRTRRSGRDWSPWLPLASHSEDGPNPGSREPRVHGLSMPAWVGEADEVQYRLSRPVAGLRLHFVNVRGTATPADRVRTALRRSANTAVVSVAGLLRGPGAQAAEPQPAIVPREQWGASGCPPRAAPELGSVKAAVIHHTVNANDYTPEEAPQVVLAICRYHRNSNGWNDIGYNFLVDKYGTIYEGRAGGVDQPVAGAQTAGFNYSTTGIANIGDYRGVAQTPQALHAIARLIRWKLPLSGAPTFGHVTVTSSGGKSVRVERISGHRDFNSTTCPGEALYAQLPELRRLVGNLPAGVPGPSLQAALSRSRVRYKGGTRLNGALTGAGGGALGGQSLVVEVRTPAGAWRPVDTVTTSGDGSFSALLHPRGNRVVRARFPGGAGLAPVSSPSVLLEVQPIVKLRLAPTTGAKGVRVRLRGTVAPRKGRVIQVLAQRSGGRWRRVGVKALRVRRGRFKGAFVPEARGRYRYYVVAKADGKTARGRSRRIAIVVGRFAGGVPAG
jgi:N-acetylmuramoyl-L-alanine amidase-like protein